MLMINDLERRCETKITVKIVIHFLHFCYFVHNDSVAAFLPLIIVQLEPAQSFQGQVELIA